MRTSIHIGTRHVHVYDADGKFEESKHPRRKDGEFARKGQEGAGAAAKMSPALRDHLQFHEVDTHDPSTSTPERKAAVAWLEANPKGGHLKTASNEALRGLHAATSNSADILEDQGDPQAKRMKALADQIHAHLKAGPAPAITPGSEPAPEGPTGKAKKPKTSPELADVVASAKAGSLRLTPHARVFNGEPVPTRKTLSPQDCGAVGEAVILAHLRAQGSTGAHAMNDQRNNFPVDGFDPGPPPTCVEMKAGAISNAKDAQKWRLTQGGMSQKEAKARETMTAEQQKELNAAKQQAIHQRKQAVLDQIEREHGVRIHARTMTAIVNPDTGTADVYQFDGFHDAIRWNSQEAQKGYVGTYRYHAA